MDRNAVAIVLDEISALLELNGENRFKARAFSNAARAVQRLTGDLDAVVRDGRLESIEGIGPATAAVIRDLVTTGESRYYAQLREKTPPGLLELLAVPKLGISRIRELHAQLGIASLDDLEQAAKAGRIAQLSGYGPKTESRILAGVADMRSAVGRRRYADARELGQRLLDFTRDLAGVERCDLAGEYRRGCETVAGIELVAQIPVTARPAVLEHFRALPGAKRTGKNADHTALVTLSDRFQLKLTCVDAEAYATTLLYATGSADHDTVLTQAASEHGLTLGAGGLFRGEQRIATHDEADVYHAIGLQWIPPELRETGEEIAVSRDDALPRLVRYEDLRGCFHCHTLFSDGKATVDAMAEAAIERGWRYLGIADHSRFASYAGGLSPEEIIAQHAQINAWNERNGEKLWLFKGIEADVLSDGRVDYDDRPDLLARFDYIVASIHSSFGLERAEQTRRMVRAMQNAHVTFMGHLTGRLLLIRRGYDVDLDAVFAAAAEHGVSIEINSDPRRMELDWRHWRRAKALGIRTAINPDAHSAAQLDFVHNGINVARKGWLESDDIVNCWPLDRVRAFLHESRGGRRNA